MESNYYHDSLTLIKNEYSTESEILNNNCTDFKTLSMNKELLKESELVESIIPKTEPKVLLANTDIEAPTIRSEIKYLDKQKSNNIVNIDSPMCLVSQVSSIIKLEVDSDSDDVEIISIIGSSLQKKPVKADTDLEEVHSSRIEPVLESSLRIAVSWEFTKSFKSFTDAHMYIDQGKYWSFTQQFCKDEGLKIYYRCNQGLKNGPPCPAQINLLFHASSGNVLLCRSFDKHEQHVDIPRHRLSERVKEEINKLYDLNLKPAAILSNLARINHIDMPTYADLEAYLHCHSPKNHTTNNDPIKDKKYVMRKLRTYLRRREILKMCIEDKLTPTATLKKRQSTQTNVISGHKTVAKDIVKILPSMRSSKKVCKLKKHDNILESEKTKRKALDWAFFKEFKSETAAQDYINTEKCWSLVKNVEQKHGLKVFYRCNQVPYKGPQCPARVYIYHHAPSGTILMYQTLAEHKHDIHLKNPTKQGPTNRRRSKRR